MLGIVSTLTCSPSAATEALFSRPAPATEQLLLGIEGELEALLTGAATGRQDRNRAPTVGTGRPAEVSRIVKRYRRRPWARRCRARRGRPARLSRHRCDRAPPDRYARCSSTRRRRVLDLPVRGLVRVGPGRLARGRSEE